MTQPQEHQPNCTCPCNGSAFIKGAIIGGLIGAAAALLLAPKSGREMRSDISDKAHVVGDKTREVAGDIGMKASATAKRVGECAETTITNVKGVSSQLVQQMKEVSHRHSDQARLATADLMHEVAEVAEQVSQDIIDEVTDKQ